MNKEEARLISMNKDEAIVAEQVFTYKRTQLEKEVKELNDSLLQSEKEITEAASAITQLKEQIAKWTLVVEKARAKIEVDSYKQELYSALLEAFNRDYPLNAPEAKNKAADKETESTSEITEPSVSATDKN